MLEDADHIGGQAAVRLAAEVGDIDGDAASGLERAHALGEDVREHLQVLEVGGGDALAFELLLVLLAGEVRRRRDDEGDRTGGDPIHVAGVAVNERIVDRRRCRDAVVVGEPGRAEAVVEGRRVVTLAGADAEVRGRRLAPLPGHDRLRRLSCS